MAGSAGGRRLEVPDGTATRPTSDRTREAVFGRLDAWGAVVGARVLDLYCGSGALALEALSRGAVAGVGVDADRGAAAVATANARSLGLDLLVVRDRVERWLGGAPGAERFDLVLLDPPYDLPDGTLATVLAAVAQRCAHDAVVVVERSSRSPAPRWPGLLSALEPRRYGDTTVSFAERSSAERA